MGNKFISIYGNDKKDNWSSNNVHRYSQTRGDTANFHPSDAGVLYGMKSERYKSTEKIISKDRPYNGVRGAMNVMFSGGGNGYGGSTDILRTGLGRQTAGPEYPDKSLIINYGTNGSNLPRGSGKGTERSTVGDHRSMGGKYRSGSTSQSIHSGASPLESSLALRTLYGTAKKY